MRSLGPVVRGLGLGRLVRDQGGTLSVEAVIVMPVLTFALAAIHVFWDGYRTSTAALRATYTVSDLMSRDGEPLDQVRLDGMRGILDELAGAGRPGGALRDGPSALRVSIARNAIDRVRTDPDGNSTYDTTLTLEWSHVAGDDLSPVASIDAIRDQVPQLAPGDELLVVETLVPWSPLFGVGVEARRMANVAITRHRFGERFCWETCPGG